MTTSDFCGFFVDSYNAAHPASCFLFPFGLTFGGILITILVVVIAVVVEGDEAELDAAAPHALGAAEADASPPHRQLLGMQGRRAHCKTARNCGSRLIYN